jgi:hypothetical protein
MTYGVCDPWPVTWPCDISAASPAATGTAVAVASELLDALSGRQFTAGGTGCELTLRPCRRDCWDQGPPAGWTRYPTPSWGWTGNLWFDLVCGACPGGCSCGSGLSEVLLPAVVHTLVEVKVDGAPLATGSYRVDDGRRLVRLDGEAWPRCQNLALDDTEDGTWTVTAVFGQPVPELGQLAAGEVACEVLRALAGEDCRLPANVTQLVRQGVTIQMADPASGDLGALASLTWVRAFVEAVNPHGLPARSRVYSVDRPQARRTG